MPNMIKVLTITDAERIDTARDVINTQRLKSGARAGYELYGISHGNNRLKVVRVEFAPTASDFAPMRAKHRIKYYLGVFDMVVEYREAWGKTTEKVIAYESAHEANSRTAE